MSSLSDFLPWRKRRPPHELLVAVRPDLLAAIEALAAQEKVSIATVVNDLLHFALAERRLSNAALATWGQLTAREQEVTALVWLGLTNPEIAARLVISPNTVKTHIRNIFAKFGAGSKEELRLALASLDFSAWADGWLQTAESSAPDASPGGATPDLTP
jgi:DNA-binding NarL/FixJ family response regulator